MYRPIDIIVRMFANDLGEQDSISGCHTKDSESSI